MPELALTQDLTLRLRARAHALDPVVLLGAAGLSEAVFQEIDRALRAHELIKVRAARSGREDRAAMFHAMADRLEAALVQSIGHTVVLFRPRPVEKPPAPARAPTRSGARAAPLRDGQARAGAAPARSRARARAPQR